jgi:hypothetical protein
MTTLTPAEVAAEAWAMLTRPAEPMPPLIARDWVMDHAGCERRQAVMLLAAVARKSLEFDRGRGVWKVTPDRIISYIPADLGAAEYQISRIRKEEGEEPDKYSTFWLDWCDRAERIAKIFRELTQE